MSESPIIYTATRMAAIYTEASAKSKTGAWVLKGQIVPGRPHGEKWVAVERDGVPLGYIKAGALRALAG